MHNNFLDKKRRFVNLRPNQVSNVLPEHYASSYPKFITLLEQYYEWQEGYSSTELLSHLFANRDINESDFQLLRFIEDELLLGEAYFEGFGRTEAEKRAAANFSSVLFRAKGTKFAIEWFFRSFYGIDAEVFYTKENVFKVGESTSQIGPNSLRYLTNDQLYQTFAILVRTSIPISKWNDIFKLFVHPAGMYLGGEVILEDAVNSAVSLLMNDSAVSSYITPTYSLGVAPSSTAGEGTTFSLTATGTNVPNNTDGLYWYIGHGTTNDSDFAGTVPDSASPEYLSIYDSDGVALGHFTIETVLDPYESEGTETFTVYLQDDEGRALDNTTISLTDVLSSYTLSADPASPAEGELITFTVNGTNVPNDGNTTLKWYITYGTAMDSSDFVGTPPTSSNPENFSIVDNVGQFSIRTRTDVQTESPQRFTVYVETLSSVLKDFLLMDVSNTTPTFNVTVDDIVEGEDLTVTIECDESSVGDTITWSMGLSDPAGRIDTTSGTFTLTGTNDSYFLSTTTADDTYRGTTGCTVTVTDTTFDPDISSLESFNIFDQASTYTITPNNVAGTEGGSSTFSISGTNIPDGNIDWYIIHGTTENADFTSTPPLTGSRTTAIMSNNVVTGGTIPTLGFASSDADTEDEYFTVVVADHDGSGTGVTLTTLPYTILGGTYSITEDVTSINEGGTVNFTLSSTSNTTHYYWVEAVSGTINSSDFSSGYHSSTSRGSFLVSGGFKNFSVTLANDFNREGLESFRIKVALSPTSGAVAQSSVISVSDTSVPVYLVSVPNVQEGNPIPVTITPTSTDTELLYVEYTGIISARQSLTGVTQTTVSVSGSPVTFNYQTQPSNGVYYGDSTGTVTLGINNYVSLGGTSVGSDTFIMSDANPVYNLNTNLSVSDSANEGDSILFTLSGTDIEPTTYYYHPTSIHAKTTDQTVNVGTSIIYLSSTSGLTIGMEIIGMDFPAGTTVTSISTDVSVTMSNPNTESSNVASGTDLFFALPETFADFASTGNTPYGSFTVSNNTGTFTIDVATDDDRPTSPETYTFAVYDAHGGNLLKSKNVTIHDTTQTVAVQISNKQGIVTTRNAFPTITSSIVFKTNGEVFASGNGAVGYDTSNLIPLYMGDWVANKSDPSFDPSDYEIFITKNLQVGIGTSSSSGLGTWLNLGTERFASSYVADDNYSYSTSYTFQIREVGNTSNSDTYTMTLTATEIYSVGGGGGLE